jgi:WW domain-containing oxidoreductase
MSWLSTKLWGPRSEDVLAVDTMRAGCASDRTIVVTGANTGIGKHTVATLAQGGCTVVMAGRSMAKLAAAKADIVATNGGDGATAIDAAKLVCLQLDLASFASIEQFATAFHALGLPLHVLINNAGIMMTPFGTTQEGFEQQLGVNHVGHFYLVQLMLPALKATKGRVVVVSSMASSLPGASSLPLDLSHHPPDAKAYNNIVAYNQSKLANLLFAQELARRYKGDGVSAAALHPGVIPTELSRNSMLAGIAFTLGKFCMKSISQGAATTVHCALLPDDEMPQPAGVAGWYKDCKEAPIASSIARRNADFILKELESPSGAAAGGTGDDADAAFSPSERLWVATERAIREANEKRTSKL